MTNIEFNTLSNVDLQQGVVNLSEDGFAPNVIPELQKPLCGKAADVGVSSCYAPKDGCQWFVLRATYNRVEKELDTLKANMVYVYLPKRLAVEQIDGKKKRVSKPLLPNMVFVYSTQHAIEKAFRENSSLAHYRFYRDKTKEINSFDKKHPPIVIPYNEMINFIRLTSVENEHIKVDLQEHCHYKNGDMVRITDGEFANVEGRVARVAGQQRVVVEMHGVCLVATAYIPSAFLVKVT